MSITILQKKYLNKAGLDDVSNIFLFISIFLGVWQLVYLLQIWPDFLFPSPFTTFTKLAKITIDGTLGYGIANTLLRLVGGFFLAIAIGVGMGIAMLKFKGFGKTMSSFSVGLQSFPSIAWVPFSILLIGFNDYGILFVLIMSSTFSMMMSTYSGLRNVPLIYVEAARNMGTNGFQLFRHVMIPASMPSLITGIRQAWSFAWHALVGAEMLMTTIGLGAILMYGREFQRMDQIIATMIVIFSIGLLADRFLFFKLEEKIRSKWGLNRND
jgi:NitT/TauT family transport system permease protein